MTSLITRAVIMVSGYVLPAYECFKSVEKRPANIAQLQFWCQYWMIIAVLTMFERLGDAFISWLPMYNEAKLAFIIYLWYPKTKGTAYVYSTFLKPFVANHEREIDQHLNEWKAKAGDLVYQYWQKGTAYAQLRMMDILQFVVSHSGSSAPAQAPVVHQSNVRSSSVPSIGTHQSNAQQPSVPPNGNQQAPLPGHQEVVPAHGRSSVYQDVSQGYQHSAPMGQNPMPVTQVNQTISYQAQMSSSAEYQPSAPGMRMEYGPQPSLTTVQSSQENAVLHQTTHQDTDEDFELMDRGEFSVATEQGDQVPQKRLEASREPRNRSEGIHSCSCSSNHGSTR